MAWAGVSAIVYRRAGPEPFALLALMRGTIGILNYTALGLAPAMIRSLAVAHAQDSRHGWSRIDADEAEGSSPARGASDDVPGSGVCDSHADVVFRAGGESARGAACGDPAVPPDEQPRLFEGRGERAAASVDAADLPATPVHSPFADPSLIYSTGFYVALASATAGLFIAVAYALCFTRLHVVPPTLLDQAPWAVALIGLGSLLRLSSDASGAVLQTRRRIALDYKLAAGADALWAVSTLVLFRSPGLIIASATYAGASLLLAVARPLAVAHLDARVWPPRLNLMRRDVARALLGFGGMVLLAQVADYFYAPTDYILINRLLTPDDWAAYAPGVQIDLALLTLVGGMAGVLLPRAALAHATTGGAAQVRRYYLRGTLASTALLLAGALATALLYPLIFRLWFGPHPPDTSRILDLVLIGTVVGGSSGIGRAILLAMGRARAFTAAAIIAGAANVAISLCLVRYAGWGLRGVLWGTLIVVIARCGFWMPWYVMRALRQR